MINSSLNFALPELPPGVDPQVARVVIPLHTALLSLFMQVSDYLGQTYVEPALYGTIPITTALAKLNMHKIYALNSSGADIASGKFVYIDAAGSLQLSGTTSATAPIGFVTTAVVNGSYGEVVLGCGYLASSGLTINAKYQADASGALAPLVAGPAIAMALSSTALYVNIPIY